MHFPKPVQDAINHINENLTKDLSLESLANLAHFSTYHFHRLFQLHTGEAPMEYIRRQRIRAASRDLVAIKFSIIEIAVKFGFESQDGFSRAFRRYYGVAPGEYRKLNTLAQQSDKQKRNEEVNTIMYDINIYERLACSQSDKKEALGILDRILELSQKVKCSGILSLEQEIDVVQPELFKKSIQLLIDGIEPRFLREILMNYTLCGGFKGKELLIRILILEGILAIQQGVHTMILREKLSSFFGEDFILEIQKHFKVDNESQQKMIDNFITKIENKPFITKEASILEEPLTRLDNRSMQRLLREIDSVTLATALSGASGGICIKVLKNISNKSAVALIDEITIIGTPVISEIVLSQKKILDTMHSLNFQGDIII